MIRWDRFGRWGNWRSLLLGCHGDVNTLEEGALYTGVGNGADDVFFHGGWMCVWWWFLLVELWCCIVVHLVYMHLEPMLCLNLKNMVWFEMRNWWSTWKKPKRKNYRGYNFKESEFAHFLCSLQNIIEGTSISFGDYDLKFFFLESTTILMALL